MNLCTNKFTVTRARDELLRIVLYIITYQSGFQEEPAMNMNYRSCFLPHCVQDKKSLPFTTRLQQPIGVDGISGITMAII